MISNLTEKAFQVIPKSGEPRDTPELGIFGAVQLERMALALSIPLDTMGMQLLMASVYIADTMDTPAAEAPGWCSRQSFADWCKLVSDVSTPDLEEDLDPPTSGEPDSPKAPPGA